MRPGARNPPVIAFDDLQDSLLHVFERDRLHVGVSGAPLLRGRGSEVVHHFFQFEQEVVFELGPLNPGGTRGKRTRVTSQAAGSRRLMTPAY